MQEFSAAASHERGPGGGHPCPFRSRMPVSGPPIIAASDSIGLAFILVALAVFVRFSYLHEILVVLTGGARLDPAPHFWHPCTARHLCSRHARARTPGMARAIVVGICVLDRHRRPLQCLGGWFGRNPLGLP